MQAKNSRRQEGEKSLSTQAKQSMKYQSENKLSLLLAMQTAVNSTALKGEC